VRTRKEECGRIYRRIKRWKREREEGRYSISKRLLEEGGEEGGSSELLSEKTVHTCFS